MVLEDMLHTFKSSIPRFNKQSRKSLRPKHSYINCKALLFTLQQFVRNLFIIIIMIIKMNNYVSEATYPLLTAARRVALAVGCWSGAPPVHAAPCPRLRRPSPTLRRRRSPAAGRRRRPSAIYRSLRRRKPPYAAACRCPQPAWRPGRRPLFLAPRDGAYSAARRSPRL